VTLFRGRAIVICITEGQLADYRDLNAFVSDAGSAAFVKNPAFLLEEGDSLFLPFATCPLVIGIPRNHDFSVEVPKLVGRGSKREKPPDTTQEMITFTFTVCVDTAQASLDQKARLLVASFWPQASPYVPDSLLTPAFKEWKSKIEEVAVQQASA